MPISRANFNKENTILYKTKIIKTKVNRGSNEITDVIDINKNGRADTTYSRRGMWSHRDTYEEPSLTIPLARIKDQIETMDEGEVALQDDLANIQIQNLQVDFSNWTLVNTTVQGKRFRHAGSLINQVAPLGSDKGIAIDTQTREFLVYAPKSEGRNKS